MSCEVHRFRTVSKADNLFMCRKCRELFTDFVLASKKAFKEIEVIETIPIIKKKGFWERILIYMKNLFNNLIRKVFK